MFLATNTSLTSKFKVHKSTAIADRFLDFEFCQLPIFIDQTYKIINRSRQGPNFECWMLLSLLSNIYKLKNKYVSLSLSLSTYIWKEDIRIDKRRRRILFLNAFRQRNKNKSLPRRVPPPSRGAAVVFVNKVFVKVFVKVYVKVFVKMFVKMFVKVFVKMFVKGVRAGVRNKECIKSLK